MGIAHSILIRQKKHGRHKQFLLWPSLFTNWDGMSILYRGPSIDASYQVSDHLTKRFQRRRFLEINQSETRIACGGRSSVKIAHFVPIR
jgi:hypothetical protein